jgi:hypothetical protein
MTKQAAWAGKPHEPAAARPLALVPARLATGKISGVGFGLWALALGGLGAGGQWQAPFHV